jgi:hypothetical protein
MSVPQAFAMYGNSKSSNFAELVVNADAISRITDNYTILPILRVNNESQTSGVIMSYMVLYCTVLYCTVLYCTVRTVIFLKRTIPVQQYRQGYGQK